MKEWILEILKAFAHKLWEYTLMLIAALALYMLTIGGCWEQVKAKFGFVEDIKQEINTENIEVPNGFEIKRKSE